MGEKKDNTFSDTKNHDVKSLLTSIKAYSQLLIRRIKISNDKDTLDYIINLDKQIDVLIQRIKELDQLKLLNKEKS